MRKNGPVRQARPIRSKTTTSTPCRHAPSAQFGVEQLSSLRWNECPVCGGTGVQFPWNTHEQKLGRSWDCGSNFRADSAWTWFCRPRFKRWDEPL